MDEFKFERFLKKTFPFKRGIGIGDDTSVVKSNNLFQLITNDILVENVHFRLHDLSLSELALKSLAVNISDIAAMGGTPEYFYLGLGFPKKLDQGEVKKFFMGLKKGCQKWNLELAGGDFSISTDMFISITMIGKAKHPVYRNNAQVDDIICITGNLGYSALGLKLLTDKKKSKSWIKKHIQVNPQIKTGLELSKYVNAMIDISDGLLIDLERILRASKKGGEIYYEKIGVSQSFRDTCKKNNYNEYELVLSGGEDYVLLFTVSPKKEKQLREKKINYSKIGKITDKINHLVIHHNNDIVKFNHLGYDHFKKNKF